MATFIDLMTEILDFLGVPYPMPTNSRWNQNVLNSQLVQAIRDLQQPPVPTDALHNIISQVNVLHYGTETVLITSCNRLLHLQAIEYTGNYGNPFIESTIDELRQAAVNDWNTGTLDTTSKRLYTVVCRSGFDYEIITYPIVPTTRLLRAVKVPWCSESGTMTLPSFDPNLQALAVLAVVAKAAAKKSFDLNFSSWARNEYQGMLARIVNDYSNKYSLSPARTGQIEWD